MEFKGALVRCGGQRPDFRSKNTIKKERKRQREEQFEAEMRTRTHMSCPACEYTVVIDWNYCPHCGDKQ